MAGIRKRKITQAEFIFEMGDHVKDVISGYEGIVVGRFQYLTGCNHYGVEAPAKDGKLPFEAIDEQRLELVEAGAKELVRRYEEPVPMARTSPGTRAPRNPQRKA